jgi:hypothetical protein
MLYSDPIEFQFQPSGMLETAAANWASGTGMTREHPILQYSHGEQRSFQFEARLFAKDFLDNLDDKINALKGAIARDPRLGRPPRWEFTWGSVIPHETVVVKQVGPIKYDDIRPDGTIRGAVFPIVLLVYRMVDVELTGKPEPSTFYGITRSGDQWEDIALREYGDPLMGDLLRRMHPLIPFPGQNPGVIVALPPAAKLRNEIIEPDSTPLRRTEAGLALRQSMSEKRSHPRESAILLR